MQCCATGRATYREQQMPELWMEGTGEVCGSFCSLKLPYLSTMSLRSGLQSRVATPGTSWSCHPPPPMMASLLVPLPLYLSASLPPELCPLRFVFSVYIWHRTLCETTANWKSLSIMGQPLWKNANFSTILKWHFFQQCILYYTVPNLYAYVLIQNSDFCPWEISTDSTRNYPVYNKVSFFTARLLMMWDYDVGLHKSWQPDQEAKMVEGIFHLKLGLCRQQGNSLKDSTHFCPVVVPE